MIRSTETNQTALQKAKMPVIFLSPYPALLPKDHICLDLNLFLAERISAVPEEQRCYRITDEIRDLLYNDPYPVFLDRYEMLFSPSYQLNVLRLFADIARVRPFYTQWPGYCRQSALIYAEPGDPEYRNYHITDHDVIVVL